MAKDPAFLFYSGDFLSGTYTMTDDQVGKYIRLLCLQHQKPEHLLNEEDMIFICKSYDKTVYDKFTKNEQGLYFNERLEIEISHRKYYTDSRSKNRKGKVKESKSSKSRKKHMKIISKSYEDHMENGNEIEIENKEIGIWNGNSEKFKLIWQNWIDYKTQRKEKYVPIGERAAIKNLFKISKGDIKIAEEIINHSIAQGWKGLFELKNNENGQQTKSATPKDRDRFKVGEQNYNTKW